MKKAILVMLVLTFALGTVSTGRADNCSKPNSAPLAAKLLDGVIVRPIGVGLSLATTALYVGTSPLTFLMNVDEPAADVLVSRPWLLTSERPLGDFGN